MYSILDDPYYSYCLGNGKDWNKTKEYQEAAAWMRSLDNNCKTCCRIICIQCRKK
ncbi:MAG: hypothetical protein FWC41_03260 [Firmicutes bacterium]|nr:hypothetical protein [Bacillota bacterium]